MKDDAVIHGVLRDMAALGVINPSKEYEAEVFARMLYRAGQESTERPKRQNTPVEAYEGGKKSMYFRTIKDAMTFFRGSHASIRSNIDNNTLCHGYHLREIDREEFNKRSKEAGRAQHKITVYAHDGAARSDGSLARWKNVFRRSENDWPETP